ncbi:MAG: O-antigen ligase family protein [Magnetococcales bacterium]|nr:O-antigen ligase family protein [Magnetococcales bacterium]
MNTPPVMNQPDPPGKDPLSDRWAFHGLLVLLLWIPLPWGSNRPWAWGLMELWIFMILFFWTLDRLRNPRPLAGVFVHHPLVFVLPALWTALPLLQLIPLPLSLLKLLSPAAEEIAQFTEMTQQWRPISMDPHLTRIAWLKGMAYLAVFWLTLVTSISRPRLRLLAITIFCSGALQAIWGLLAGNLFSPMGLHGTFVNRNHFAGFLELTIPVGFGLLVAWLDHQSMRERPTWRESLEDAFNSLGTGKGMVSVLLVTMFLALFLSRSRGGSIALLVALFLVSFLARQRMHQSSRERRLILPLLLVAIIASAWFGLEHLVERMLSTQLLKLDRLEIATSVIDMIRDYPWTGVGAGAFATLFPMYRNPSLTGEFYDHAHNDHLEILAEQGIVGYLLLALAMGYAWRIMGRAFIQRRDPFARGILLAGLAATFSLELHALVDFNFHIPANAVYFMVVMAMGLQGASIQHPNPSSKRTSHDRPPQNPQP